MINSHLYWLEWYMEFLWPFLDVICYLLEFFSNFSLALLINNIINKCSYGNTLYLWFVRQQIGNLTKTTLQHSYVYFGNSGIFIIGSEDSVIYVSHKNFLYYLCSKNLSNVY